MLTPCQSLHPFVYRQLRTTSILHSPLTMENTIIEVFFGTVSAFNQNVRKYEGMCNKPLNATQVFTVTQVSDPQ
jgi:hypothetical protein